MAYRRDRRVVVEDRNPMWAIIGVLVILLILFLAWMFFRNDDLREDEGRRTNTEERQDQPEGNIQIPGGDDIQVPGADAPTTGDDPTARNEPTASPTTGDVPPGGGTPGGSG